MRTEEKALGNSKDWQRKSMDRINATDLVVTYIRNAIQKGELKTGDKLPREADMAQALGVGRSSLREGIKILNAYGVVESRQGEGTFIVDNRASNFFDFMGFLPSNENMVHFLELRRVIEVGNIFTVCGKLTEQDLANLEGLVDRLCRKDGYLQDYVEADKEFHSYLITSSKNPMLIQVNKMITSMRSELLHRIFQHEYILEDARISHREILEALKKGDRNACVNAVYNHIDVTVGHVADIY